MQMIPEKQCFVICPIGDPGSDIRAWSDDIFSNLLLPIAKEFHYKARRAIDESRPGEITTNIIADIISADLVIADLTFHNANVFYELALRHAQGTPFFHVAAVGTKIPFDISTINTVFIDRSTISAVDKTRDDLRRHFTVVQDGSASFDNPVKRHQQKLKADQSGDPLERRLIAVEEQLATVQRYERPQGVRLTPKQPNVRFETVNTEIFKQLEDRIRSYLANRRFVLTFNPLTGNSKVVTFQEDGSVGEGRNQNETWWRVSNGRLEFLDSNKVVHSRFVFSEGDQSFRHTNDPDTPSIKGQYIVPEQT